MAKKKRSLKQYENGGTVTPSTSSNPWLGFAQMIPNLSDSIIDLVENNPKAFSKQPIINATTMRNMVSPYSHFAMGGVAGIDESQLAELQQLADEQGITIEELIAMMTGQEQEEELTNEEATELMDEEEQFAMGGLVGKRNIEVEGDEVVETPNGQVSIVAGPSHSKGGVDITVPSGTEIFSKRLKIDGKTMAQRKLERTERLNKLQKLLEKNPLDKILKSTIQRTTEVVGFEEEQDMQIQNAAQAIYNAPKQKFATGGSVYGYDGVPVDDGVPQPRFNIPYMNFLNLDLLGITDGIPVPSISVPKTLTDQLGGSADKIAAVPQPTTQPAAKSRKMKMTLGDYIGMGGNLFNAVAPLINTDNNADAQKPNVNRFLGFGKDAIDQNSIAQNVAAGLRTSSLTDIGTSVAGARARARNSAMSVNTIRALDAVTDMGANRSVVATNDAFAKQMIGLLGQRGQLENIKDKMEMTGEVARDIEDKADIDNYFTNKAENLVNFGTNIQGIGRSLNQAKGNQVNMNLLRQLSQYGLEFDDEGNLISTR